MKLTRYSCVFELPDYKDLVCVFTYLEQGIIFIEKNRYIDLIKEDFSKCTSEELNAFLQIGALVEDDFQDVQRLKYYYYKLPYANPVGRITIVTTYECNMMCYYCLQNDYSSKEISLNDKDLTILLNWLPKWLALNKIDNVEIEFIGGEPLLNMTALIQICECLKKTQTQYSCSLITNGSLLDRKKIEQLYFLGVRSVQLTFDGPKEYHDTVKSIEQHDGNQSSYEYTKEIISVLLENNINTVIRVNYPKGRSELAVEAAKSLSDLDDKQKILLYFAELFELDCYAFNKDLESKHQERIGLYNLAKELGFKISYPFSSIMCKAESDTNYTITPNLEVFKCYLLLGEPSAKVGDLTERGLVITSYASLYREGNEICFSCMYFPICRGGCPASKAAIADSGFEQPNGCPKEILFKHVPEYLSLFVEANYREQLKEIMKFL
jgi:uncharacterized protein